MRDALGGRAADDLVVDVGEVHDPRHAQAAVAQVADQEVREQEGPEVADVGRAVDRRAAAVDPDVAGLERLEGAGLARERVLQADRHAAVRSVATARAEMERPAPSSPARLPVEALTLTAPGSMPRIAAIASRMASSRAPSLGRAPMTTMSIDEGESPTPASRARDLPEERRRWRCPSASAHRPGTGGPGRRGRRHPAGRRRRRAARRRRPSARRAGGRPGSRCRPGAGPGPGPNGWLSWPKPTRTAAGRERLLGAAQVVGQRHLDVRGFAGDRMDGDSTGLEQGGLVGELRGVVGREAPSRRRAAGRGARPAASGRRRASIGPPSRAPGRPPPA